MEGELGTVYARTGDCGWKPELGGLRPFSLDRESLRFAGIGWRVLLYHAAICFSTLEKYVVTDTTSVPDYY